MLRTDRGGEFANKAFDQYLTAHSIRREYTTPYTPEQNYVVERDNRTIMEGVRSCLHQAKINIRFWAEAVQYLVNTFNRTCTRILYAYTPFEAYFGLPPSVSHLRPFGCPTYVHIPAASRQKLDPKAQQGIFVGYSDESKAFRIWISSKSQLVTSRDVTFDEAQIVKYNLPASQSAISHSSSIPSLITNVTNMSTIPSAANPLPISPSTVHLPSPQILSPISPQLSSPISSPNSTQLSPQISLQPPVSSSPPDPYDFSISSSPIQ